MGKICPLSDVTELSDTDPMSSGPRNTGSDEILHRSYMMQLDRQHQAEQREAESEYKHKLLNQMETQAQQLEELRKSYDVKISNEADQLEKKLAKIRERNQETIDNEKELGELEAEKTREKYQAKILSEKLNGQERIAKLQRQYKEAQASLERQQRKSRRST